MKMNTLSNIIIYQNERECFIQFLNTKKNFRQENTTLIIHCNIIILYLILMCLGYLLIIPEKMKKYSMD